MTDETREEHGAADGGAGRHDGGADGALTGHGRRTVGPVPATTVVQTAAPTAAPIVAPRDRSAEAGRSGTRWCRRRRRRWC